MILTWLIPSIWNYKEVSELPNFQQAVNQTLSTAGVLAGLSGIPQRKAAEKAEIEKEKAAQAALDKKEQVLAEAADVAGRGVQADVPGTVAYQTSQDIAKERTEVARQQFERNPSNDTYRKYSHLRSMAYGLPGLILPADEEEQSIAMDRVSRQQEAMKTQRRNFMSYLAQQSTSLGGTVGDLPMPIQKQIASQYSKSQRKTMMDRMDKEAKNGKQ